MSANIRGASDAQAELLREILDGLAPSRIASMTVRPWNPQFEGDIEPPPGPYGDELVVDLEPEDARGDWEAELLGRAFAVRSASAGLTKVAWLSHGLGGATLAYATERPVFEPLDPAEIAEFRSAVEVASGAATVERFEVLRPLGSAAAISVFVDEPHSFLRYVSHPFLTCLSEWRRRCDGIFAEVRDREPQPALTIGWFQGGGFDVGRRDVACCAPFLGMTLPLSWTGPPPCPVLGPDSSNE